MDMDYAHDFNWELGRLLSLDVPDKVLIPILGGNMRRILALLEGRGVTSTFFVPGHTARAYPDTVKAIHAAGHEIGHHGWVHENPVGLSPEEERYVMEKGLAALAAVAGVRPVGYRSPGWDNSPATVPLLVEFGFEYESSLMGSDYEPYWCRVGDVYSATEELRWGTPVNLVELPVAWHLDDFIQFEFVATPTGILNASRSTAMAWEIWKGEFDYLYHRVGSAPTVEQLANDYEGRLVVAKVDVETGSNVATQFGVMNIPTLMLFKGGQPVDQIVGTVDKDAITRAGCKAGTRGPRVEGS